MARWGTRWRAAASSITANLLAPERVSVRLACEAHGCLSQFSPGCAIQGGVGGPREESFHALRLAVSILGRGVEVGEERQPRGGGGGQAKLGGEMVAHGSGGLHVSLEGGGEGWSLFGEYSTGGWGWQEASRSWTRVVEGASPEI